MASNQEFEKDLSFFNTVIKPFRRMAARDQAKEDIDPSTFEFRNIDRCEGENFVFESPEKCQTECPSNVSTPSPWEAKRLKWDLGAARAQIKTLNARVTELHTMRNKIETLYRDERATLMDEHYRDERSLADMKKHLDEIRAREQEQKENSNKAIAMLKKEHDEATAQLIDLMMQCEKSESLIMKLKKRLQLVTSEWDGYRDDKDSQSVALNKKKEAEYKAPFKSRVEQKNQIVQESKNRDQHSQDSYSKALESLQAEASKWRNEAKSARYEAKSARYEADNLRKQRDQLQVQVEKLTTAAADTTAKVLHLVDNPAAAEYKKVQTDLGSAQEEIKRLKAALREGASDACPEELQQLRQQLESSCMKMKRLKQEFMSTAREYRNVFYMLLGYKIDIIGHKNYRISNMYAESPEEYLTFTLGDEGLEMVHTEYSATLGDLMDLHLNRHRSIPVFLSALTMDLFTKTTMHQ